MGQQEEENNEEITNIMQSSEENEEQFERQVHFEIVNPGNLSKIFKLLVNCFFRNSASSSNDRKV